MFTSVFVGSLGGFQTQYMCFNKHSNILNTILQEKSHYNNRQFKVNLLAFQVPLNPLRLPTWFVFFTRKKSQSYVQSYHSGLCTVSQMLLRRAPYDFTQNPVLYTRISVCPSVRPLFFHWTLVLPPWILKQGDLESSGERVI